MDLQKPIVDHLCGELDIEKNKYYPMIRKKIIIKYQFCLGCVKYVTILICMRGLLLSIPFKIISYANILPHKYNSKRVYH